MDDGVEGGRPDGFFAPVEEFDDLFGGDVLDVLVDVGLQVAHGAAVGLDGAFGEIGQAKVLFLPVDGILTDGVMGGKR